MDLTGFFEDLDQRLLGYRRKLKSPGLVFGLSIGPDKHFFEVGLADLQYNLEFTRDTPIRIGSVSEIFTAILIMQVVQNKTEFRGREITLTDNPERFLKQMEIKESEWSARYVTFSDLLAHTSGFGDVRSWRNRNEAISKTILKSKYLEDYYSNSINQKFTPKSQWYPSIHNYGILGSILEKIYSKPFHEIVDEKILQPLGLTNTSFNPEIEPWGEFYEKGIFQFHYADSTSQIINSSHGGISSVKDLTTVLTSLLADLKTGNNNLLNPESISSMFTSHFQPMAELNGVARPFIVEQDDPLILSYSNFQESGELKIMLIPEFEVNIVLSSNLATSEEFNGVFDDISWLVCNFLDIKRKRPAMNGDSNWIGFGFEGTYRFSKSNRYNGKHNKLFGKDLFISRSVENDLELSSNTTYRKNRPWILDRMQLNYYQEARRGFIFAYSDNRHLRRLFFPKSEIAGYVIIETPGPRLLYRSKSRQSFLKSLPRRSFAFISFVFIGIFIQVRKFWRLLNKYSGPVTIEIINFLKKVKNWIFSNSIRLSSKINRILAETKPTYKKSSADVYSKVGTITQLWKGINPLKKTRLLKNIFEEIKQRRLLIRNYRMKYPSRITFDETGKRMFKFKIKHEFKQLDSKIYRRNNSLGNAIRNVSQILIRLLKDLKPSN